MAAILVTVIHFPNTMLKVYISCGLAAVEAFLIFPWWFSVIHLFAVLSNREEAIELELIDTLKRQALNKQSSGEVNNASAAQSWRFGETNSNCYSIAKSSSATKISEV